MWVVRMKAREEEFTKGNMCRSLSTNQTVFLYYQFLVFKINLTWPQPNVESRIHASSHTPNNCDSSPQQRLARLRCLGCVCHASCPHHVASDGRTPALYTCFSCSLVMIHTPSWFTTTPSASFARSKPSRAPIVRHRNSHFSQQPRHV